MRKGNLTLVCALAAMTCLAGNTTAQTGLCRIETDPTAVYYMRIDGVTQAVQANDYLFETTLLSSPPTAPAPDAISILFSFGGTSEVAWARPYADGTVQLWDKGDVIAAGTSHGRQHDVEGGATTLGTIVTSAACAPYDGITITVSVIADEDGDGVVDAYDICPGTPPGTQVNADGCPDEDGDGVADADDLCLGTPPGAQINADGCPDQDGDGVTDADDLCPWTPTGTSVDEDGCPAISFVSQIGVSATGWADYNNDGYSDMLGASDVYTNNGDGTFTVTTPFAAVYGGQPSIGDYNNDGLLDHYSLGTYGGANLYFNNGDETWTLRYDLTHYTWNPDAVNPAEDTPRNSNAQTCVDLNGDGILDTYMTGWWDYDQSGSGDVIFTGEGDGVSDPCWRKTWEEIPYQMCKGATPCDFDEDGDQDVFVSGYWGAPGHLWRNDSFDGYTGLADVGGAYGVNGAGHTQGSCWADFDNDGHFDLFVANFAHPGNPSAKFHRNDGAPNYHFTDLGLCGITQVEPLSCGIAGDYDNDGDVDILITVSGGYSWQYIMMYTNNGDWTFTQSTNGVGLGGQGPQDIGAWGDYDNDGDLDLIANGQLWRNDNTTGNHWLKVKLLGGDHPDGLVNGAAIGAQARIDVPGLGTLTRQVEGNTGQVGCQNDLTMHFGLGRNTDPVDIDVVWPNGYQETVYGVAVDQAITVQLEPPLYDLTCVVIGNVGGTISASSQEPAGATCPVAADPCDGWQVVAWGGDADIQPGAGLLDNTVVMDGPKTVTVEFGLLPTIPPCWDYPTQCHGDCDGSGDVDTADWPTFRDAFGYTYPDALYNPCGDLDHDGDVDTADWPEFRDNFGYPAPTDCTLGGTWPPAQ